MKKNIIKLLSLVAVAVLGWSCETDYFNEHNLDGWEPDTEITDVQSVEYTLTAADYATIANNSSNKTIAEAAGAEAVAALAAVKTNCYFTSPTDAETYLKSFVSGKWNNFLSNGSSVSVNYDLAEPMSEELQALNAATTYTVSAEDYKKVWESEEEYYSYVTPATLEKLPAALSSDGLEAGDYVVVTYNYSVEEPSTGNDEENPSNPDEPGTPDTPDTPPTEPTVKFPGAGQYLIVAQTNDTYHTMCYVPADKSYAYPKNFTGLTPENSQIAANETSNAYAFMLEEAATEGQYHIREVTGSTRYYVNSGKFNNFSVNATLDAASTDYAFTITKNDDGTVQIKNVSTGRVLQQGDGSYTSYGLYDTQLGSYPRLYKLNAEGSAYVDVTTIEAAPANNYTSVLATVKAGDEVEVKGYISAISKQGPILTDNSGSIWLYKNNDGYAVGDELTVKAKVSAYKTCLQIETANTTSIEKTGTTEVSYPTPVEMTGAMMDAELTDRTADQTAVYVKMTGTTTISSQGYVNFIVDGAAKDQGSVYGATDELKTILTNGLACTIYGYYVSISSSKYLNVIVTKVETATSTTALYASRAAVQSEKRYGYYQWDGTAFSAVDINVVQPSDYEAMNNKYGSITYPQQDIYIPKYLNQQYPYAVEGDVARVAFRSYNSGTTAWVVEEYLHDGSNWARNLFIEQGNAPFKKSGGEWLFNPSRTIVVAPDKSEFSKLYYQTVVDYVYNNKHEGYTLDNRTNARITDAEYYSGCAAGYTNLNWRINTLPKYYWSQAGDDVTPYENWSSDDMTLKRAAFEAFYAECEKRFGEVMAVALGQLHGNQKMIEGVDVIYTVQMMIYANANNLGSSTGRVTHAFEFKVVGDGQFEYVRMYPLEEKYDLYADFN